MANRADYFEMQPTRGVENADAKTIAQADKIKTADEWQRLGFDIELNAYGLASNRPDHPCRFFKIRKLDSLQQESITLDKKPFKHHNQLLSHLRVGCAVDDFVGVTEDARYFVDGIKSFGDSKFREAAILLHAAVSLSPQEVDYRTPYYNARIEAGDLSGIEEEFMFLKNDMDSAVHSGRFDIWLNGLINANEFDRAEHLLSSAKSELSLLCQGRSENKIYGKQSQHWYDLKLQQLLKRSAVFERKILRKRRSK